MPKQHTENQHPQYCKHPGKSWTPKTAEDKLTDKLSRHSYIQQYEQNKREMKKVIMQE